MVSPGMPKVVDVVTPGGQSAGSASMAESARQLSGPLFPDEQLRQFAFIQSQAPWLYGIQQSAFNPPVHRPAFLEQDASRVLQGQMERNWSW